MKIVRAAVAVASFFVRALAPAGDMPIVPVDGLIIVVEGIDYTTTGNPKQGAKNVPSRVMPLYLPVDRDPALFMPHAGPGGVVVPPRLPKTPFEVLSRFLQSELVAHSIAFAPIRLAQEKAQSKGVVITPEVDFSMYMDDWQTLFFNLRARRALLMSWLYITASFVDPQDKMTLKGEDLIFGADALNDYFLRYGDAAKKYAYEKDLDHALPADEDGDVVIGAVIIRLEVVIHHPKA